MDRAEELQLIRLASTGDRKAAGALIRGHQGSLYAYILRLSGRADMAEDVVQESFVRVLGNLDRFDSRFRFSTWLFTIGRRVYYNLNEKRRPVSDSAAVDAREDRRDDAQIASSDRALLRDVMQQALMTLPHEQREIIVLFHQHEWPIWLIAEHLNLPEGTVKSHLHRGRLRLRDALKAAKQSGAGVVVEEFKS
ncbi:MAG: RNA polymerase sigma factor [Phycisphaerales bacterium]